MARFCTNCGKELPADTKFCIECGAEQSTAAEASPVTPPPVRPTVVPAAPPPIPPQPVYQPLAAPGSRPGGENGVVGTGAFFGLMLLFVIPVIGWIACIIMAFVSKNANIRNFARAMLIWLLIALVLSIAMYFAVAWLTDAAMQYINEATGGSMSEWMNMMEQLEQLDQYKNELGNLPIQ